MIVRTADKNHLKVGRVQPRKCAIEGSCENNPPGRATFIACVTYNSGGGVGELSVDITDVYLYRLESKHTRIYIFVIFPRNDLDEGATDNDNAWVLIVPDIPGHR